MKKKIIMGIMVLALMLFVGGIVGGIIPMIDPPGAFMFFGL